MKIFIALSCLLAMAAAQHYGQQQRYNGPYHVPVIGPNGVPQETPEVIAARNKHLAAYQDLPQQAPAQQWNQGHQQQQQQWNQPQQQWNQQQPQWNQAPQAPVQQRYNGPLAKIGPDGMPQYDAAVAQARAAHQAAYSDVNSRNAALHSQINGQSHQWGK